MLIERDNNRLSVWRALDVLAKGRRSISADVPKNLTANVFNNHFLCVTESLRNLEQLYMSARIFHMISANKKLEGQTHLSSHIFPFRNYKSTLENQISSGLDGISKQLLNLSLPYITDSLTYIFNLFIEKNIFPFELKKATLVLLPKFKDKTNPINYRPISLLSVLSKRLAKHVTIR